MNRNNHQEAFGMEFLKRIGLYIGGLNLSQLLQKLPRYKFIREDKRTLLIWLAVFSNDSMFFFSEENYRLILPVLQEWKKRKVAPNRLRPLLLAAIKENTHAVAQKRVGVRTDTEAIASVMQHILSKYEEVRNNSEA